MIVCLCNVATDKDINTAISDGARTVDEVGDRCGAGTGCGSCREFIHGMIEQSGVSCSGCDDCPNEQLVAPSRLVRAAERGVAA